jgi:hypothetical protein
MQPLPNVPAITSWQTVPAKTRLGDCLHVFPIDPEAPTHLDVAANNATLSSRAIDAFMALPRDVPCCLYGARILLHNPEYGSIEKRARHVSHFRDRRSGQYHPDEDKCRWLPCIPATLLNAAAVFDDFQDKTVIFARKYATGGLHFVIVRPLPSGFQRDRLSGYLITQFSFQEDGRQETFRLRWRRQK